MTLSLPQSFIDEMIAHAQEDAPNECCGIIAGEDGRAVKLFRARNADASPLVYNVDSKELYRIHRECEDNGWEFLAMYHSHTASEAYPSATDVKQAFWPESYYLLVSLYGFRSRALKTFLKTARLSYRPAADRLGADHPVVKAIRTLLRVGYRLLGSVRLFGAEKPVVRAYRITGGKITEEELRSS